MLKKLKSSLRKWGNRKLNAQIDELRVAVAALLAAGQTSNGSAKSPNDVDAVLLHAASAHIEMERLNGLYEATIARVAAVETRLRTLEESLKSRGEK